VSSDVGVPCTTTDMCIRGPASGANMFDTNTLIGANMSDTNTLIKQQSVYLVSPSVPVKRHALKAMPIEDDQTPICQQK